MFKIKLRQTESTLINEKWFNLINSNKLIQVLIT
jgi:hypothetical protein